MDCYSVASWDFELECETLTVWPKELVEGGSRFHGRWAMRSLPEYSAR